MSRPAKVVIAQKTQAASVALQSMLTGWGYDAVMAADGVEAWQMLRSEDAPCIALLDWTLPLLDGIDVCRRIQGGGDHCNYVYTILLTERRPVDEVMTAMDDGADDYVLKPLRPQELRARVRVGSRIIQLQERLVQARTELYDHTTRDTLTGIWNRSAAIEILDNELARGYRTKSPLAAIMADLDELKKFNAEHGHQTGDAILRQAAQRMSKTLRKYDSIGRYGGEEFLIVLPNCPHEASMAVAERLRRAVSDEWYPIGDRAYPAACSLGVAWTSDSDTDAGALLRAADEALSSAKQTGRNRFVMAGKPLVTPAGALAISNPPAAP